MKSIDSRLGNVKLSLENFSLNHIEEKAVALRQEIFEKVIKDIFARVERQAIASAKCTCGSLLVKNGSETRTVATMGVKVTYPRTRMLCKSCGKNYYPLDEAIGIPNGTKHSLRATEAILDMVTDLSYAKTSRYLAKLAHIEVSPQKIASIVSVEGAKLLGDDERQRIAAFEESTSF